MTIKRRGEGGTNGVSDGAAKGPSLFDALPANDTVAPVPVPDDHVLRRAPEEPQACLLRFVAPGDPLLTRLPPVDDFYVRAMCKLEYADRACWGGMSSQEAVAFRLQPLFAQWAAAGQKPNPEQFQQVCDQILAGRAEAAASVRDYGPTAERTVLVRVPLIKDQDGNFVPDPALVATPEVTNE